MIYRLRDLLSGCRPVVRFLRGGLRVSWVNFRSYVTGSQPLVHKVSVLTFLWLRRQNRDEALTSTAAAPRRGGGHTPHTLRCFLFCHISLPPILCLAAADLEGEARRERDIYDSGHASQHHRSAVTGKCLCACRSQLMHVVCV